jgi:5-methylcytosine-specific restriction endonuclease McrA
MRYSLREPIPELELAAKLLDAATEALILGKINLAGELIEAANFPEIKEYAISIVGKMSFDIHRQIKLPKCIPPSERDSTRMPTKAVQNSIFIRDGWRCRFCGVKVICKTARSTLTKIFTIETNWTSLEFQRHSALYALASSLDHLHPHARGGKNDSLNFVTACYGCQFGRGNFTLKEVEIENPLTRNPIIDSWDGLTRLNKWKFN